MSRRPSPGHSRAHSAASSLAYLPDNAEVLIIPDVPFGESTEPVRGSVTSPQHGAGESSVTLLADSDYAPTVKTAASDSTIPGDIEDESLAGDDEEERLEREERMSRPFYRRPSPWWMSAMVPLAAITMSATIAPRIELYTKLACEALRPEYTTSGWIDVSRTVQPPSTLCGQDPEVQAAVAKLVTSMTVSMGILSCLTTGWWGQLSDRYGRLRLLRISSCGLLAADCNFILVSLATKKLPGGYYFLLVGPIVEGLLGGMSTLMAGLHAYVSDTTPPEARSRIFSLNLGLLFGGMAFGPTLGGLMIRATNNLLSVFYMATGAHFFYTCLTLFVLPESLTRVAMKKAWKRREMLRSEEEAALVVSSAQPIATTIRNRLWGSFKRIFAFMAPLGIFLPYRLPEGKGWNFSLTLLVLTQAFGGLLMGSYQFKFQYAQRSFGWNSETLGYWLSTLSVFRAVHLIVVLPLLIKWFTPRTPPVQLPVSPSEPLHPERSSSSDNISPPRSQSKSRAQKHNPSFDLALARISLAVELTAYIGMALAKSPMSWIVPSLFSAFGGGYSPAMQSVALALYERSIYQGVETGRLFGGLSVVQALSTQIFGPSLFGMTYVSTVNTFPKGIFVLACGTISCALFLASFIRLSTPAKAELDREETAVEVEQGA